MHKSSDIFKILSIWKVVDMLIVYICIFHLQSFSFPTLFKTFHIFQHHFCLWLLQKSRTNGLDIEYTNFFFISTFWNIFLRLFLLYRDSIASFQQTASVHIIKSATAIWREREKTTHSLQMAIRVKQELFWLQWMCLCCFAFWMAVGLSHYL